MPFKVGALQFDYFDHPYNTTIHNERAVEVPLGQWFLDHFNPVVEVGAVMPYYGADKHHVIDLFDSHPAAVKEDATQHDFTDQNVLSISTVEHVGKDDYGGQVEPGSAIKLVKRIIQEANNWLITWPVGYADDLDHWASQRARAVQLIRTRQTEWERCPVGTIAKYGWPYPCGNSVYILTSIPELCV